MQVSEVFADRRTFDLTALRNGDRPLCIGRYSMSPGGGHGAPSQRLHMVTLHETI